MYGLNKEQDATSNDLNIINQSEAPTDSVSCISWAPNTNVRIFACSGWDSKIRLYDCVAQNYQKGIVQKACLDVEDPCLGVNWSDDMTKLFAGCVNNKVKAFDVATGQSVDVGAHDGGVKDVYWIPGANTLCSLSFDKTIRFWDLRSPNPVAGYTLGQKVYCSDLFFPNLAIGLSDEKILVVNLPNMQNVLGKTNLDYIDSPLGVGSQLTAINFFADGTGIGIASHDGRANLSKIDDSMGGRMKLSNVMTFKCHKVDQGVGQNQQMLYPVHAIGFHPKSKNFVFTAGGEGNIFFWDYAAKNKIVTMNFKGAPVTKCKMSPDGALMAYSLGYDWAKGIEGFMSVKSKVCAHIVQDNELIFTGKTS